MLILPVGKTQEERVKVSFITRNCKRSNWEGFSNAKPTTSSSQDLPIIISERREGSLWKRQLNLDSASFEVAKRVLHGSEQETGTVEILLGDCQRLSESGAGLKQGRDCSLQ